MQTWIMSVCETAYIPQDCTAVARLGYAIQMRHTVLHMLLCTSNGVDQAHGVGSRVTNLPMLWSRVTILHMLWFRVTVLHMLLGLGSLFCTCCWV